MSFLRSLPMSMIHLMPMEDCFDVGKLLKLCSEMALFNFN